MGVLNNGLFALVDFCATSDGHFATFALACFRELNVVGRNNCGVLVVSLRIKMVIRLLTKKVANDKLFGQSDGLQGLALGYSTPANYG